MAIVRTVLGDRPAAELGRLDYHEHLFQVSPLLPGDELDDEARSGAEAELLRRSGIAAMVEATPTGLGRDAGGLARISAATGLTIVATTGAHREAHYGQGHWLLDLDVEDLARRFVDDVVVGIPVRDGPDREGASVTREGAPVQAGVIKGGIGYWSVSPFERRVLAAVARAHVLTGAPIMVHLEHGSAAFELLAALAEEGVAADAVALAHVDRNPDPVLHAELAAAGAYLGYDGFARSREWPDTVLLDCFVRAAELGAGQRLLLGGDVARRTRYVAYGGMPGLAYLGERIVTRLLRDGHEQLADAALRVNAARWLGGLHPPA